MPRNSTPETRNPVLVATFVDLLRAYSEGAAPQNDLERQVWQDLDTLPNARNISQKQIARFDSISTDTKARVFGRITAGQLRNTAQPEMRALFSAPATALALSADEDDVQPVIPSFPRITRFTLDYTGIYCRDRTDDRWIFGGSDEVYVITAVVSVENGLNVVRTEQHPLGHPDQHYSGVDDGEFREGPFAACWDGTLPESELSVVVTVMEHDEGDPDAFEEEIEVIVKTAAAIAAIFNIKIAAAILSFAEDAIKWLVDSADDTMGTSVYVVTTDHLRRMAAAATNPLVKKREVVVPTGPFTNRTVEVEDRSTIPHHFTTHHIESGDYFAAFRFRASNPPDQQPQAPEDGQMIGGVMGPAVVTL